jgi:hypothetical protein
MAIARLILAATLAVFLFVTGVAQEVQTPPPASAAPAEPEQAPPPQSDDGEPRTLEQIFIPSEEIGADEEVTFPINI